MLNFLRFLTARLHGKCGALLIHIVAAVSRRLDALDDRVGRLEAAAPRGAKAAGRHAPLRRRTAKRLGPVLSDRAAPLAAILGERLKADGRHCFALIRRTGAVLRSCLAAL